MSEESEALSCVFGYTAANDITARHWAKSSSRTRGKSFDRFCPLGPALVTADEIPDPQRLILTTTVNDLVVQKGSTADMIFSREPEARVSTASARWDRPWSRPTRIPDPQRLILTTTVNDLVVQKGSTADMIFSVAQLVSFLSRDTTLLPGTLILTGTPPGIRRRI